MARELLIDSFAFRLDHLSESQGGDKYTFTGKFGQCDLPTANGRVYSRAIMEREVSRLKGKCIAGKVYGELDHPDDGKTKLQRSAVLIKKLWIDEQGQVMGVMSVLNTSMGKELQAIIDGGGAVGVSSRGYGSILKVGERLMVQEDFTLLTYDPVADPAEESAYPEITKGEDKEGSAPEVVTPGFSESIDRKTLSAAIKKAKTLYLENRKTKERKEALALAVDESYGSLQGNYDRKDFSIDVAAEVLKIRESKEHKAMKNLASNVQFDNTALQTLVQTTVQESVASLVSEKDALIESLRSQIQEKDKALVIAEASVSELSGVAKELGYSLYVQQHLASHPRLKIIRESLGDLSLIESLDSLKTKISAHTAEVTALAEAQISKEKELQESIVKSQASLTEAKKTINVLTEERDEAVRIGCEQAATLYLERRISKSPAQSEIRLRFKTLDESHKTIDGVNKLLESYKTIEVSKHSDYSKVRNRIGKTQAEMIKTEAVESHIKETRPAYVDEQIQIGNVSQNLSELKRLAGV